LEMIFDRFVRNFRPTLETMLNRRCVMSLSGLSIEKFDTFSKKLVHPSSMHLFRMPPLAGQGLVVISSPLCFATIDSMFGGRGRPIRKAESREYTPLEKRLISRVVLLGLENLKESWSIISPVDLVYGRAEQDPMILSIAAPHDSVTNVQVDIELGNEKGSCIFCFPGFMLEPIREKLSAGFHQLQSEVDENMKQRLAQAISNSEIDLRIVLAHGRIKMKDVLKLQVGDVIPLATDAEAPAIIEVQGTAKFEGEVGIHHGRRAVKITRRKPD
ncbi:MAG TPA: flagellar motor switch protein FliM, partial [Oligoflexia bacterium]|nr:flagellar motor switch protein FliM [Oligoflexia bacterium]